MTAAFLFDLASPDAYLAAERVLQVVPGPCEWIPVCAAGLPGPHGHEGFRCAEDEAAWRDGIERRAAERGLQPVRWPEPYPFDSALAMRVATYARSTGRTVAYALAAFRQAFAGGRDLSVADNVLIAAAACEMHPRAVLASADRASIAAALEQETAAAAERGVRTVPAIWTGEAVHHGDDGLDAAAAELGAQA
jgi:2-hydroxychromene-2-carboxylate isomerase